MPETCDRGLFGSLRSLGYIQNLLKEYAIHQEKTQALPIKVVYRRNVCTVLHLTPDTNRRPSCQKGKTLFHNNTHEG